jgi:uncharacterized protein (DUF1810 family)
MNNDLDLFVQAQERDFSISLKEIKNARKRSHWMWYIFPQLRGMGHSYNSDYYDLNDSREAESYLFHPLLGPRLVEISESFLENENKTAREIMGVPDDRKLKSCMTLFAELQNTNPVFDSVLQKFFQGKKCYRTLGKISDR